MSRLIGIFKNKKIITLTGLTALIFFLSNPITAWASNCQCFWITPIFSDNGVLIKEEKGNQCFDTVPSQNSPVNTQADCTAIEETKDNAPWPQNASSISCVLKPASCSSIQCSNDFCDRDTQICQDGACLAKTDRSCTNNDGCKQLKGTAVCSNELCYMDSQALELFTKQDASLLGFEADLKLLKPLLSIHIPGLKFSDLEDTIDDEGYLHLPYIPEYLAALYKFGMAIASILAVVMLVARGFDIVISKGGEGKAEAYKKLGRITIGLLLVWGSYFILYTINPDLVAFKVLKVRYINPIFIEDYNKKPDDNQEGGQVTTAPFTNAEINKYAHQGCGKNLPQIALAYANQMICQGPLHCANFVSKVLLNSGCDASYTNDGAGNLAQILIKRGWRLIKGHQGVSAGDILFWGTTTPGHHTAIATDGNGGYIDSSSGNIAQCWPSSIAGKIKSACGDFKDPAIYPWDDDTPAGVQKKEAFSRCVADNSGCSPNANTRQESCGYCAKTGPADEFLSVARKQYKAPGHQCIAANTIPLNQAKWAFYVVNPNK